MTDQREELLFNILRALAEPLGDSEEHENVTSYSATHLSTAQLWSLAHFPDRPTADLGHLESCPSCRRVVARYSAQLTRREPACLVSSQALDVEPTGSPSGAEGLKGSSVVGVGEPVRDIGAGQHPSFLLLALYAADVQDPEGAGIVRSHLEDENCRRCHRITESITMRVLTERLRLSHQVGADLFEELKQKAANVWSAYCHIPALGFAAPTGATIPPVELALNLPEGTTVMVRENDRQELVAYAADPNPQMAGRTVQVEFLGQDNPSRPVLIKLKNRGEFGCWGQMPLGQISELLDQRPGAGYLLIAYLVNENDAHTGE